MPGAAKAGSAVSVCRIPVADIEDIVVKFLKEHLATKRDGSTTSAVRLEAVRPLLSEHHLRSDSKDVVKLTAGLIGTLMMRRNPLQQCRRGWSPSIRSRPNLRPEPPWSGN